tara:strand:- start:128 stop:322 length:195 start_codon:yes stop_codon:yes gene_type:complete
VLLLLIESTTAPQLQGLIKMIKHDYKQDNKEQEEETILETILAGITFVALIVSVSTCIYIIGSI